MKNSSTASRSSIEGEHVKEVSRPDGPVARAASCRRRDAARPRRPHRDAGAYRCPRPHLSHKAAAGGHGEHAADVDGRQRHGADAFDAACAALPPCATRPAATSGSRRPSTPASSRPSALHLRHGHEPDRRPRRLPPQDPGRRPLPLLFRPALHEPHRRRRAGDAQSRPRGAAEGRRPHQAHGLRRRGLAQRPARQPAVPSRRDRSGVHRSQKLGQICQRQRLGEIPLGYHSVST